MCSVMPHAPSSAAQPTARPGIHATWHKRATIAPLGLAGLTVEQTTCILLPTRQVPIAHVGTHSTVRQSRSVSPGHAPQQGSARGAERPILLISHRDGPHVA